MKKYNSFRVYPNKKNNKMYFWVTIADNKESMYQYYKYLESEIKKETDLKYDFNGMCYTYNKLYKEKYLDKIGNILLFSKELSCNTICHESTHAGLHYVRFLKLIDDNVLNIFDKEAELEQEEELCYAVGEISSQIVNKCYELGYYQKDVEELIEEIKINS